MRLPGIGSHHSAVRGSDEWLTPPHILDALGRFDLDPCASLDRPWPTAREHYTIEDDGLTLPWHGRVWLNPPYSDVTPWMKRMAEHQDGIALVFARCETSWWFEHVWPVASGLLFLKGRLTFRYRDGSAPKLGHNSGGPSVAIAYSSADALFLRTSGLPGAYVEVVDRDGSGALIDMERSA